MSTNTAIETTQPLTNGVDVNQIMNVIGAIENDTNYGKFQFRASNQWIDGSLNRSHIHGYFAGGKEDDTRAAPFILDADEPPLVAGNDTAPNSVEYVLHALVSCLTGTLVYHAAVQGLVIEAIESTSEGDMDVRGLLGMSEDVRKGYNHIRVHMRVKSDASAEQLTDLAMYSPVYDIVSKSVPCEFILETR